MNGEYMDLGYMELKNFKLKSLEQIYGIRDEDDYIFWFSSEFLFFFQSFIHFLARVWLGNKDK